MQQIKLWVSVLQFAILKSHSFECDFLPICYLHLISAILLFLCENVSICSSQLVQLCIVSFHHLLLGQIILIPIRLSLYAARLIHSFLAQTR